MNKQTLTYELKIKAIIDSAQKDLAGFGQAMGQAWANGEPPKSLLKAMESMRQRLGSLSEIAQKGVVDSSDLAQAEDDYKAFTKTLHSLTVEFGLFTAEQKKAMLSPEEQKAMQGRVDALKKYNEELKRSNDILEKRKPLEKQQTTQSTKVKNLTKKKEDDESTYKTLKEQGGPRFSKESQVYMDNQKRILELNEKIRIAQEKVNKGETLGKLGEGKNNEWTRAAESLERYQKELAEIDSEAGKVFYDKELKDYNESLSELERNIGFTSTALDEAKKELSGTEEQLKKLKASDPKELFNDLVKQLKDLGVEGIDGVTTFEQLEKAVTKLNSKALAKVDDALTTAKQELLKMGQAAKEAKKGIDESTAAIKQQEAAIAEREAFEGKIKQFLGLAGAVEVMKNAFRNAFATIKELDATMGEMAVVTDLTVGDYWDQLPEYSKRASELGVSINSAYEAATLYYQQGLKTNEVIAISTETLKMARIAGLSAEDATQKMTAALRGFNMELNETSAQRISDVYSELAAITAADVEQIANAMSKTASIASSAGMEFETTAAFLAQIVETTQESAETAGTAMKTVIARFQELKKAPSEIGEVDGEIVDANAIETALRSVGVSLRDANGQFRDLDDVFLELASKWKTLDKNTQRYIATIAAGSRQQSRFLAMMSDYERTQELVTAANDSAGASNKQFEKTMDTLEAKLEKLKNAWDEFAMGILNSDLVKVGVDILTKFLEIVNKATGAFKGLGGSIVKILSVITMFKLGQKIFDKFKQPLFKFFSDLTKMGYQAGYDAGKAYADGVKKAKQESSASNTAEDLQSQSDSIIASNQKQSLGRKMLEKTGLLAIGEAKKDLQNKDNKALAEEWEKMVYGVDKPATPFGRTKAIDAAKQERINAVQKAEAEYNANKQTLEDMQSGKIKYTTKTGKQRKYAKNSKEMTAAQDAVDLSETNLTNARKELVKFDETQKQVQKNGQEGWEKMGEGISQLGGTVMALGVAVSALGGIFDALGMEEVSEAFATAGSIITMLGGAISAIGTLVPIVTKILVASGYSVQSAWWPLLVIGLAIAAIVGIVAGITAGIKAAEAQKLENRMKAAAEATEEAKKQAEEAKQAYDELLDARQGYDELLKSLDRLVYGTKEWKQALVEANQQVLQLLTTYPELAAYVHRTEDGRLEISDEGWDALIDSQKRAMNNTQAQLRNRQIDELNLRTETDNKWINGEAAYSDDVKVTKYDSTANNGEGGTVTVSSSIREKLEEIYLTSGSNLADYLAENNLTLEEMADQYGMITDDLASAAKLMGESAENLKSVELQTENLLRANLTANASETVVNSEFSSQVVDAFVNSKDSDYEDQQMKKLEQEFSMDTAEVLKNNKTFEAMATEYGVASKMTGNNLNDAQQLYMAMTGLKSVEEIPEEFRTNFTALMNKIAEMKMDNDRNKGMDSYTNKLEQLASYSSESYIKAKNYAGALSEDGAGMTTEFAQSFFKEVDGKQLFDQGAVNKMATDLGYENVEAMAKDLNLTTEELYKQIEQNSLAAIKNNERVFKKLNNAIGISDEKITKFGKEITVSTASAAGLSEKLLETIQTSSVETVGGLKEKLDAALDAAGPETADKLASTLNAIDWQSMADWDGLRTALEAQGITWTKQIEIFVNEAKIASQAIDLIDFEKLTKSIQSLYNTLRAIDSGEQNRAFDKDTYELLVATNKELAKDFTQIGDKFYYLGGSMDTLTAALEKNTTSKLKQAEKQASGLDNLGSMAASLVIKSGDKELDLKKGYENWTDLEKRSWLSSYAQQVAKGDKEKGITGALEEGGDAQVFSYLSDSSGKSLGMSLGMSFDAVSDKLDTYLESISKAMEDSTSGVYKDNIKKMYSDNRVANYTRQNVAVNRAQAHQAFANNDEVAAYEYSKAMAVQAVESGMVSEATNSEYAQLLEKLESGDFTGTSKQAVEDRLKELQGVMVDNMQNIIYNQEGVSDIIQLQNDVAEALLDARQKEIDKLSDINDSINSAQEEMVSKVQEQIDDARQARENEKQEKAIADQQSQMTYLMASSNGGGMLEAMALQQNIQEAQEAYGDSLIDQSLQQLSDDNAAAAEQRERQIALLEAQLAYDQESGEIARQAEEIVNESLNKINTGVSPLDTRMGALITGQESWESLSSEQYGQQMNEFMATSASAANASARLQETEEEIKEATEDGADTAEETNKEIDGEQLNATTKAIKDAFEAEYGVLDENGNRVGGNKAKRAAAVAKATEAVQKSGGGFKGVTESSSKSAEKSTYDNALKEYLAAGGDEASFKDNVKAKAGEIKEGVVQSVGFGWDNTVLGNYDEGVKITVGETTVDNLEFWDPSEDWDKKTKSGTSGSEQDKLALASGEVANKLTALSQKYTRNPNPTENSVALYDGKPYLYRSGKWRLLFNNSTNKASTTLANAIKTELNAYKEGGLADFTGPAWLDGTKARPELVLNARDTQNFIQLKDILADILDGTNHTTNNSQNKQNTVNTIDIDINVESIGDDYDVEQLADKIRSMLYDDATYRNVNTISLSH